MRLAFLLLHPLEIVLNALQDALRFARSVLGGKPFSSIPIVFGIIAPIFAMTKRNDVGCNSTRAIRSAQRNPVVGSKGMPESSRTTANSATVVEVAKTLTPVIGGKRIWQTMLASLSAGIISFPNIGVPPIPIRGAIPPLAHRYSCFGTDKFGASPIAFLCIFAPLLSVVLYVSIVSFLLVLTYLLAVRGTVIFNRLLSPIWMALEIQPLALCYLFGMFIGPLANMLAVAFVTFGSQAVFLAAVLGESTKGFELTAFIAIPERMRNIQHICNLSPLLLGKDGPAPRKAVVERFMRPFLALNKYSTNGSTVLCG